MDGPLNSVREKGKKNSDITENVGTILGVLNAGTITLFCVLALTHDIWNAYKYKMIICDELMVSHGSHTVNNV